MTHAPALLAGIGVVEVATEPGSRYCSRLFAALGATVVTVARTPAVPTAFDRWLDVGKLTAPDLTTALRQIETVSAEPAVAVCGQTVAAVAAAGALLAGRDLLRLNLTWFGQEGPYRAWTGDDAVVLALCGAAHGFGTAAGPPLLAQGHAPQLLGGTTLFLAGLAALWGRKGGCRTDVVDVSILESALCFLEHSPPGFATRGGTSRRRGINHFGGGYPTTAYRSADGWIGVTAHTGPQWQDLCALIGRPELATDPRFTTTATRAEHAATLDAELALAFLSASSEHWLLTGQHARVPLAPVPTVPELLRAPHWRARGSFTPLTGLPRLQAPGLPFRAEFDGKPPKPSPTAGPLPLSGVRVVDFTMGWAGPLATRHLGDLGADIVKVESERHFDWARGFTRIEGSDPPAHEVVSAFNLMNRNKRGVVIELDTAAGRAQAEALVATADVVIENCGPGVMAKLGLSPATLRALRGGLIVVSMAAFGAFGPWQSFRAYGSTVEQASGLPFVNGHEDWPPCLQHAAYGDPVGGIYAAAVALAALHGRRQLGGAYVDLSQVECVFQLAADAIIDGQLTNTRRRGSRSPSVAPRVVVAARGDDAWLAVTCTDTAAWHALARLLGRHDWIAATHLGTAVGRNQHGDEIEAGIAAWACDQDAGAAAQALQDVGVAAAAIVAPHALLTEPHLVANNCWATMERAYVGRHLMLAPPYRLDGARPPLLHPAPLLGEHTHYILGPLDAPQ